MFGKKLEVKSLQNTVEKLDFNLNMGK